ncbi:hypothetical protein [Streptomyces cucumeris]|uniref:hypothetical protein n=1 Tax=Streptomyces cucumeris TaxID=2962890 RepID=UPI0020C8DD86|nr:hypothetical protein [Streptomyces sp. NEAU-Y11]MCP9209658.1 hypothetical protein [Streptomyces sp. NEAU-Y11]
MIEIDMTAVLSDDESGLAVFLYCRTEEDRARIRLLLEAQGAEYVMHPGDVHPARIDGSVVVARTAITVFTGPLYVMGEHELQGDLGAVKQATLLVLDEPFNANDESEKAVLAATLPLEILERGSSG